LVAAVSAGSACSPDVGDQVTQLIRGPGEAPAEPGAVAQSIRCAAARLNVDEAEVVVHLEACGPEYCDEVLGRL
jgi:hypothetical protein